jgi:hypothetical protein
MAVVATDPVSADADRDNGEVRLPNLVALRSRFVPGYRRAAIVLVLRRSTHKPPPLTLDRVCLTGRTARTNLGVSL